MKKLIILAAGALMALSSMADEPFRLHRYDSFKATPTEEGQIIFAGNSITNMHSWFEAFGSHQEVIGRGNSGGLAYEVVQNMEYYIDSKPSKLFLMIGTNDISSGLSAEITAKRIQTIVKRVRLESPETEVYVESILPRRSNAKADYENCNTIVRNWIEGLNDSKVHFVNLSQVCAKMGPGGRNDWNYDNLHPTVKGYTAWTHEVQDYVGYPSIYPAEVVNDDYELSAIEGFSSVGLERAQQFEYYPVMEGDVWFFGDEQVHGGEWHELLRSNKIKDRGTLWGWGGLNLTQAKTTVTNTLNKHEQKPAKIFLFFGIGEQDATKYGELIDAVKELAPTTQIYCVALSPSTNSGTNTTRVNFNTAMRPVAEEKGCTYVDVYTPLAENTAANIMSTNYISGRGYVVMANALAPYLEEEGVSPVTIEEYDATYARRSNRKIVGDALTQAFMRGYLLNGDIRTSCAEGLPALIDEAVAAVNDPNLTTEAATEIATRINSYLDQNIETPTPGWYVIQGATSDNSDYIINADAYAENDGLYHNEHGVCPLVFSPTAVSGPQGWIYIDVVNGHYQLSGINGWHIGSGAIGSHTAYNTTINEGFDEGMYAFPGWTKFTNMKATHAGSLPIVGGSSGANFQAILTRVPDADVAAYDKWTVTITDLNAGTTVESLYLDTRVTLDIPENHGITTVYNNGLYFLTPGTEITPEMISVHTNAPTTTIEVPLVEVDNDAKTIHVTHAPAPLSGKRTYYVPVTSAEQLVDGGKYQIVNHNANWASNRGADHYLTCTDGTVAWVVAPANVEDTYWTLEEDLVQNGTKVATYPNRWYKLRNDEGYFNYATTLVDQPSAAHSFSFIHRDLWPTFSNNNMAATETDPYFTMDYKLGADYYTLGVGTNFAINNGRFTQNTNYPHTLPYYNASWSFVHKLYQVVEVDYERVTELDQINGDDRYVLVCHNINWPDKAVTFNADGTRALTNITTVMADPRSALLQFEPVSGSNDYLVRNAGRYMRFIENANNNTVDATATPEASCYVHFNKTSLPAQYVTAVDDVDGVYFEVIYRTSNTGNHGYVYSGTNAAGAFGKFGSNNNYYNNNSGQYSLYFQLYKVKLSANDAYTAAAETVLDALKVKNNIGDDPHQYALTSASVPYLNNLQAIGDAATSDLATSAITSAIDAAVVAYKDANATSIRGAVASPRPGMYLRIYNPDGDFAYALGSGANSSHNVMATSNRDASTIFYYDGEHLINYSTGYYITGTTLATYPADAAGNVNPNHILIVPSWYTPLSDCYCIALNNDQYRALYASANAATTAGTFSGASTNAGHKNYAFRLEKITELPVSIHSDGSASIIAPVALKLQPNDDVEFYLTEVNLTEDGNHTIVTTPVDSEMTVPANTAVIIYAPGVETVSLPIDYAVTEANEVAADALMHGHYATRAHSAVKREGHATFVKAERPAALAATFAIDPAHTATFINLSDDADAVPAHAVVMHLNAAQVNPGEDLTVQLGTEQTPTSIIEVEAKGERSDAIYDLQGRRVATPTRGIFIINGRKVLK